MSRGFTLVEIVTVLVILGITAAAVVPALSRVAPDDELTRATRRLEKVLASSQGAALERAATVEVAFVPESNRYWTWLNDSTALDSGFVSTEPGVRLWSSTARPRIRFRPVGTVDADSLMLTGPNGAVFITIDRWTGKVDVAPR